MKTYNAIYFWFGGVLTDTVSGRTKAVLSPGSGGRKSGDLIKAIRKPAEMLSLGKINILEYCHQSIDICASNITAAELAHQITDTASINQTVVDLVSKIPEAYARWLVVDYPPDWFEDLSKRWDIESIFPRNQLIFTSDLNLPRMVPEIFYRLPSAAGLAMDDCMVIDPVTARATAAMRHGLAAIIYVYPERLKHELALQGIWQTDEDVMHPTSSERVKM